MKVFITVILVLYFFETLNNNRSTSQYKDKSEQNFYKLLALVAIIVAIVFTWKV